MILNISVSHRPANVNYFSPLFDANNFELNLIIQKLEQCMNEHGRDAEILVEKLALNGVHVARCCDLKNLADLSTLIQVVHEFSKGDFVRMNRAIGAFDQSNVTADELMENIDVIAPVAYDVKDNYIKGVDIRQKDKYKYVEVGKGILIGLPIQPTA